MKVIHFQKLDYLDTNFVSGSICGLMVGVNTFKYTGHKKLVTCKKCSKELGKKK